MDSREPGSMRIFTAGTSNGVWLKVPPPSQANSKLGTIEKPPFYGLELHPSLGTSSAGLLTNEYAQVIHQRRRPIPGLYASGVAAARTELGAGYQAGLNLASGMTFSYLAIQHMLNRA